MKSFAKMIAVALPVLTVGQETWQSHLTTKEAKNLGAELNKVQKHAKHEEYYAQLDAADHPEQVNEMQQEHARKMADILKKYQRMAADNVDGSAGGSASSEPLSLIASSSGGGSLAWTSSLTRAERVELNRELNKNQKDGDIQLEYAKEYGQEAADKQRQETRRHEHNILMKFKRMHFGGSAAQNYASIASSSMTPIMASAVGMASGAGIMTAFIVAGKSGKLWRRESTEPLISSDYQVIV